MVTEGPVMSQGALTFVSPRPQLPTLRSTAGMGSCLQPENSGPALGTGDLPGVPQVPGTALQLTTFPRPLPNPVRIPPRSSRLSGPDLLAAHQRTCVVLNPQPGSRVAPRLPHSHSCCLSPAVDECHPNSARIQVKTSAACSATHLPVLFSVTPSLLPFKTPFTPS